jgi:peptide/nickel transport system permease protein
MAAPVGPVASGRGPSRRASLRAAFLTLWKIFYANPLTLVGFLLVVVIAGSTFVIWVVPAVSPHLVGHAISVLPYSPNAKVAAPYLSPSAAHPFGTDDFGRDVFSRVLAALPIDISIGLSITLFSVLLGGSLGLVSGFWDTPGTVGGAVSVTILRITDVFLAFPSLVLALAIAASLGRSFTDAVFAIAATWWPFYVRLVRGEVLAVKNATYVTAARAAGLSSTRILSRHIVRNILEPIVVYYTLDVGSVLIAFSTITFIGLGIPPGIPEWGNMISEYSYFLLSDPWPTIFAGGAVFVTVLAFSLLGDGLRDVLDPRSRRALAVTAASAGELSRNAPTG